MIFSWPSLRTIAALCLNCIPAISYAVSYQVTLDMRPLAALNTPPAPFALEIQLTDGGAVVVNTVTLSNFSFGIGGGALGNATVIGGASGNLSSTITLTDTAFFNEFIQGFTPSSTAPLSFNLDLTTNIESTTPDGFSLAIFDSSGTGIPTRFFDVFIQIDIANPLGINTYASDASVAPPGCPTCAPIVIGAPTLSSATVPIPTPLALFVSGISPLLYLVGKKSR